MTIDINPLFAVGPPVPKCQLTCQNGGYCSYISSDERKLVETFASGGMIEHCVCPPGYSGLACENVAYHAPCTFSDGRYVCDCKEADDVSSFAGAMCREPSTTYCGQGDIQNRGFCTNGGICKGNLSVDDDGLQVNNDSTHNGCHCPHEFEGPHCEYLIRRLKASPAVARPPASHTIKAKTIITPTTLTQDSGSSQDQSGVLAVVGVFLGIAMSIFGVAILTQRLRRSFKRNGSQQSDVLERECYQVEPIRVKIMGELEDFAKGHLGYKDDEDVHSVSECSLEEIELASVADDGDSVEVELWNTFA